MHRNDHPEFWFCSGSINAKVPEYQHLTVVSWLPVCCLYQQSCKPKIRIHENISAHLNNALSDSGLHLVTDWQFVFIVFLHVILKHPCIALVKLDSDWHEWIRHNICPYLWGKIGCSSSTSSWHASSSDIDFSLELLFSTHICLSCVTIQLSLLSVNGWTLIWSNKPIS